MPHTHTHTHTSVMPNNAGQTDVAGKSRSPQRPCRVEAPREVQENEEKFKAEKARNALEAEKKRQRELKKKIQAEKNEKAMKRQSILAEKSKHLLAGAGEKASKVTSQNAPMLLLCPPSNPLEQMYSKGRGCVRVAGALLCCTLLVPRTGTEYALPTLAPSRHAAS